MDVDSPSDEPVQAREELKKLVKDISDGLWGLGPDAAHFEEELECDIYAMENKHQSPEEHYKSTLEEFKKGWDDANRVLEQSFSSCPQQPAQYMYAAAKLCYPVEKFMAEFQTLQQAAEAEISHPEISFMKDLGNLRERIEERKWTVYCLKEKLDDTDKKLDNVYKRVEELEKLAEQ
ncbi:hypothetical protein HDV62DRAFT_397500 [Trichoderma sp. SZMC 28011]